MEATIVPKVQKHYPVLLKEIISVITPQYGGTFIDCTFGQGGYSKKILEFKDTKVIAIDRINDLALIKIATQKNSHLKLASNDSDRLDSIITAGFPYGDSFSSHVKSTTGIVSALVGPGNNTSQLQISASIQPGNSGGPIIDGNNGSVVGVAVAKLDTEKFIEMYRSIPENVNFAIKSSTLKRFLKSNKIEFSSSDDSKLTNKEINSLIDSAVLFISC